MIEQPHTRFVLPVFEPDDLVELRPLQETSRLRKWLPAREFANTELSDEYASLDVCLGINPRTKVGGGRNEHAALCRCLVVDIDVPPDEHRLTRDEALARLEHLPAPTALVSSGRGWHAWWRLEDPIDPEAWTRHQVVLNGSVEGADASIKDPARILRLPGTVNQKRGEPVELVEFDANRVYPLSEFPEPIEDNAFAPSHTDSQPTRR